MPGARIAAGERVTLRTREEEDRAFVQRSYTNPEIRYPMGQPLSSRDELEEWLDREGDEFLVCLEDDVGPGDPGEGEVRPVGLVAVADADWKRPELGYWLVPEVHGEGYGTEAVSLVVDFVFRTYATPAVSATAYVYNEASRSLLESLGFTEEGRLRKHRFVDGQYRDLVVYGLLREDWED